MNTRTIFAIVAFVTAVGIVTPSIISNIVFADKGGIPNKHALPNPLLSCLEQHEQNKCHRHFQPS